MGNNLDIIKIENLIWKPDEKTVVLKDISIDLGSNEFYGILGPNGAGKTSLIRQLLMLTSKTSGNISFDEKNIKDISRKEIALKTSFLAQNINNELNFPVREIVAMGREPYRKLFTPLSKADRDVIEEALEWSGCTDIADKSYAKLSGGEKRRVMIARVIAQDTPWIILDEPISNLDVRYQTELMNVFYKLQKEKNKTIIAVLHDINLAINYCSKILLMKNGRLELFGDTLDIINEENLQRIYEVPFEFIKRHNDMKPIVFPKIDIVKK